jgi:hypothetical protein
MTREELDAQLATYGAARTYFVSTEREKRLARILKAALVIVDEARDWEHHCDEYQDGHGLSVAAFDAALAREEA